jgi:hypothetical protein
MNKRTIASWATAMIFSISPVIAGSPLTPSEKATLIGVASIASPLLLASALITGVKGSMKQDPSPGNADESTSLKAKPLPPMRVVEKINHQGDGDEVVLTPLDERFGGERTVLRFPAMNGSPANSMDAGDVVTFIPAGEANGWWAKSEAGNNLAYVPTASTAKLSGTKVL